jgi:hypothetical protein
MSTHVVFAVSDQKLKFFGTVLDQVKKFCQDSRMKYIVVMFFMLSSCAVLAQMQFGIMQML